jgi:hypothetical protein
MRSLDKGKGIWEAIVTLIYPLCCAVRVFKSLFLGIKMFSTENIHGAKSLLHYKKNNIIIVFYSLHPICKNAIPFKEMNYLILVLSIILLIGSSCHRKVVVVNHRHATHRMPPGQAKKMTGSKSARAYAPGHQKKH